MRRSQLLVAALALALAHGSLCHAGPFLTLHGDDQSTIDPSPLRIGGAATAWNLPTIDVSATTGAAGDRVDFRADVVPVFMAEYRLTERLGIGGWYNPLYTDIYLEGPTADLLLAGPAPVLSSPRVGRSAVKMWSAHANYRLPSGLVLQAGALGYSGSLTLRTRNPRVPGALLLQAQLESTELHCWAHRTWRVAEDYDEPFFFTGGLGVRHRIDEAGLAPGPKTSAEASVALSYFPSARLSVDLAAWFTDLTNHETFTSRFNAGITGRF